MTGPISIGEAKRHHERLMRLNSELVNKESHYAARHIENHVYQHPYFKPRTGNLQARTQGRVVRLRGGRKIIARNAAKYAAPIDRGARPHVIRPRRRKALRFVTKNGTVVFARKVNHPGNRPYRFLWRATYSAYRLMGDGLSLGVQRVGRQF